MTIGFLGKACGLRAFRLLVLFFACGLPIGPDAADLAAAESRIIPLNGVWSFVAVPYS